MAPGEAQSGHGGPGVDQGLAALPQQAYPYDENFQRCLLALAVQDPGFLACYRDCLSPAFFEDRVSQYLAKAVLGFYDQYGSSPGLLSLQESVADVIRSGHDDGTAQSAYPLLPYLFQAQVPDTEFIRDRAVKFARRQGLKRAVFRGLDVLKRDGDPEDAMKLFQRAMGLGQSREPGTDLYEAAPNLAEAWKQLTSAQGSIPTQFLPSLDLALHGGPRRGEIYVIQGLPGGGKSQFLVNVGVYAIAQGYRVLHITIGDLKEFDVSLRYMACFTSTSISDIISGNPIYQHSLSKYYGVYLNKNQVRIRYYSPYTLTPAHVRSYISWLKTSLGFEPDLLIVDYPDKMLLDRSNTYSELGRIYMELKGILDDFNCVGWVASQSNRQAAGSAQNRMANVAESWDKAANADGIFPISQTEEERAQNKLRLGIDKLRFGRDHFTIECAVDFAKSKVLQTTKLPEQIQQETERRMTEAVRRTRSPVVAGNGTNVAVQTATVTGIPAVPQGRFLTSMGGQR